MAEVSVKVGGRTYQLACGDGEEARLTALAARIDAEARALSAGGVTSEARLLLMAALMVADKLDEAETALAAAPEPEAGPSEAALAAEQEAVEAVERIEASIIRLDGIARARQEAQPVPSGPVPPEPEAKADKAGEPETATSGESANDDAASDDADIAIEKKTTETPLKTDTGGDEDALTPFERRARRRARRQAAKRAAAQNG